MTLDDLTLAMTKARSAFGFDKETFLKWLDTEPSVRTETGHVFMADEDDEDSHAYVPQKLAIIGTKIGVPGPVRSKIPSHIAHEAQHLIDGEGKSTKVQNKMADQYDKAKEKYGDDIYTEYHEEIRAKAREYLTVMKLEYERQKARGNIPENENFITYAKNIFRTVPAENRLSAKYMYEFLLDDAGKKVGIDDLPSDKRLKKHIEYISRFW